MEPLPIFFTDHAVRRFRERVPNLGHPIHRELETARTLTYKQRVRYSKRSGRANPMLATVNLVLIVERVMHNSTIPAWKCITVYRRKRTGAKGFDRLKPVRDIEPADIPEAQLISECLNARSIEEVTHDRYNHIAAFIRPDPWQAGTAPE